MPSHQNVREFPGQSTQFPGNFPKKIVFGNFPFRPVPEACSAFTQPSRTPNFLRLNDSPVSLVSQNTNTRYYPRVC